MQFFFFFLSGTEAMSPQKQPIYKRGFFFTASPTDSVPFCMDCLNIH